MSNYKGVAFLNELKAAEAGVFNGRNFVTELGFTVDEVCTFGEQGTVLEHGLGIGDYFIMQVLNKSGVLRSYTMQIAGIDHYTDTMYGDVGHHIDWISKELADEYVPWNKTNFRVLIESIKRKSSVLDTLTVHIEPFTVHEGMAAVMITSEKKKLGVPEGEPPNPNFVPTISQDELTLFMLDGNDFSGVKMEDNNNSDLYDIELVISPESEIAEEIIITSGTPTADLILSRNADDTIEFKTVEAIARINAAGELIISEGKNYTYKIEGRCLIAIPKEEGMPTLNVGRVKPQHKGTWSINTEYDEMDIVSYNGHSYWVLQKVKGVTPADDGVNYALMI